MKGFFARRCGATPSPVYGRRWPRRQTGSDEGGWAKGSPFDVAPFRHVPHPTSTDAEATFSRKREKGTRGIIAALLSLTLATAATAAPLRIGVEAPLSGADAIYGNQLKLGVEQAVADMNAKGGFLGQQAKVVTADDGNDPKKGVEVAKNFAAAGIKLVVGPFSSAVAVPASAVYAEAQVLDITPSATAPQVTDRGLPTIFRACGREDQQAAAAARFLLGRHYVKIAVLHDRTGTGKALADSLRKALSAAGVEAAYYNSFSEGSRDIAPLVARMRAAGTQIVFWGGGPQGAAQLAKALRDARIGLIGGLAMASDEFPTSAGAAADGAYIVFPQDPRKRPEGADLLARLKAKGSEPDGYVFYAYAAVEILKQASDAARSLDPAALAEAMHAGQSFQTVLGPITFDAKGDPTTSDLTVYVWHKGPSGRMVFLDPANS